MSYSYTVLPHVHSRVVVFCPVEELRSTVPPTEETLLTSVLNSNPPLSSLSSLLVLRLETQTSPKGGWIKFRKSVVLIRTL